LRAEFVAVDASGSLFISEPESNRVRKVTPDGIINTAAGKALSGFEGDGGNGSGALLARPLGLSTDTAGNLYIADSDNHRIRKVSPAGLITTAAGNGTPGYNGDGGPATAAQVYRPRRVATDPAGSLFITDAEWIREVTTNGTIRSVSKPSLVITAGMNAITFDSMGNLFVADGPRVLKINPEGQGSVVAGSATQGFSGDGGPATLAQLVSVSGLAIDHAGNLYICDQENHRIRKVSPSGIISTIAGDGTAGFRGDGGPAIAARLNFPANIIVDGADNLFVADQLNQRLRKISASGTITTIVGNGVQGFSGDGGSADAAQLSFPSGLAIDSQGTLYISEEIGNRVRKVVFLNTSQPFDVPTASATYLRTLTDSGPLTLGYARILPKPATSSSPSAFPNGVAIYSYRSNGVLVSETAVPASRLMQHGRVFTEMTDNVKTGVAIANPSELPVDVAFYFTDKDGMSFGAGSLALGPYEQVAGFLDATPYQGNSNARSFTYSASAPVGTIALRGTINERNEFLMTTLPVAEIPAASAGSVVLPHYAAGAGWSTEVILVNPTDEVLSGSVQMDGIYPYTIAPRSAFKILSETTGAQVQTGNVRILNALNSRVPAASVVFKLVLGGVTVTENGTGVSGPDQVFSVFAEFDVANRMRTGIAIANTATEAVAVQFQLRDLSAPTEYSSSAAIEGGGHLAFFLDELAGFGNLPPSFKGVLRITSSKPITVIGLRERYNERSDFLISTIPAIADTAWKALDEYVFAHLVTGGGYATEFILMSPMVSPRAGYLSLTSQAGAGLPLSLVH
jgi:hypothetical protein